MCCNGGKFAAVLFYSSSATMRQLTLAKRMQGSLGQPDGRSTSFSGCKVPANFHDSFEEGKDYTDCTQRTIIYLSLVSATTESRRVNMLCINRP
jgi:hypothetical protein